MHAPHPPFPPFPLQVMYEWPTYPAIFINGKMVGGVDALVGAVEAAGKEGKTLPEYLQVPTAEPVKDKLTRLVNSAPVVLFMKGVADAPQCGFSARTVDTLAGTGLQVRGAAAQGVFASVNILADPDVRQGMKDFSNWPTFPQLYVRGEFIGGADIVGEMAADGSLKELLQPVIDGAAKL